MRGEGGRRAVLARNPELKQKNNSPNPDEPLHKSETGREGGEEEEGLGGGKRKTPPEVRAGRVWLPIKCTKKGGGERRGSASGEKRRPGRASERVSSPGSFLQIRGESDARLALANCAPAELGPVSALRGGMCVRARECVCARLFNNQGGGERSGGGTRGEPSLFSHSCPIWRLKGG